MSLEQRVQYLEKNRRWLVGLLCVALAAAMFSFVAAVSAFRTASQLSSGDLAFEVLKVRSLLIGNDDEQVVASMTTNSSGNPSFNMYDTEKRQLFSVHASNDVPMAQVGGRGFCGQIMMTTDSDLGGRVYVYNREGNMCSVLASDKQGNGLLGAFSEDGKPLVSIGRGAKKLGSVAAYTEDGKRTELAKHAPSE